MKTAKLLLVFLILLNFTGCNQYEINNEKLDNRIIIKNINIDNKYEIKSKYDEIKNIAMFKECGRPDINNSNVVIGAHSGTGKHALFNNIHKLKKDDEIIIYYNNKKYVYVVSNINEVKDTEIDVLENKNKSILTLLTCKINDNSKRVVVISVLKGNI